MPLVYRLRMALGLLGGGTLALGTYVPLVHIPIVGTISYLHHPGDFTSCAIGSVVILIAAMVSVVGAALRRFRVLWLAGAAAIVQIIVTVETIRHTTAEVLAKTNQP